MPSVGRAAEPARDAFVRLSPRDPRYFELTDGRPYIPVGFNLVGAPGGQELEHVVETMADHGVLQVHRYLDLGAGLPVCRGPVDVLAADAVEELRAFGVRKPILLAETGAVRPNHTSMSELHAKDQGGRQPTTRGSEARTSKRAASFTTIPEAKQPWTPHAAVY